MDLEPLASTDQFSRDMARAAAQQAAQDYRVRFQPSGFASNQHHRLNRIALHAWGALAGLGLMVTAGANIAQKASVDPLQNITVSVPGPFAVDDGAQDRQTLKRTATFIKDEPTQSQLVSDDFSTLALKGTLVVQDEPVIDMTTTGSITPEPTVADSVQWSKTVVPKSVTPASSAPANIAVVITSGSDKATIQLRLKALLSREPALFAGLSPRLLEHRVGGKARYHLTVDGFSTSAHSMEFCRAVRLQLTLTCSAPPPSDRRQAIARR